MNLLFGHEWLVFDQTGEEFSRGARKLVWTPLTVDKKRKLKWGGTITIESIDNRQKQITFLEKIFVLSTNHPLEENQAQLFPVNGYLKASTSWNPKSKGKNDATFGAPQKWGSAHSIPHRFSLLFPFKFSSFIPFTNLCRSRIVRAITVLDKHGWI